MEETLEEVKKEVQEEEEGYLIIGGDFNARTGNAGGPIEDEKEKVEEKRRSKDKVINKEERVRLKVMKEREWMVLNGSGKEEGGWTYIGEKRASVIDYVVTNNRTAEEIEKMVTGVRTESDH